VDLRQAGGGGVVAYPTCHAHTAESSDEFDVAVGLSTGEGEAHEPVLSCRPVEP
jgi:hypothetical protein